MRARGRASGDHAVRQTRDHARGCLHTGHDVDHTLETLSRRAFEQPRGHADDAVLIDHLYGLASHTFSDRAPGGSGHSLLVMRYPLQDASDFTNTLPLTTLRINSPIWHGPTCASCGCDAREATARHRQAGA